MKDYLICYAIRNYYDFIMLFSCLSIYIEMNFDCK